jgi:UDP-N-acetylglucosamine acyltransferase
VFPGDRLHLEVTLGRVRSRLAKAQARASVDGQTVLRRSCCWPSSVGAAFIDSSAHVHPSARIGEGTTIGPQAIIGADVTIGRNCLIGSSVVVEGWTEIGDETQIYPMASIGLAPQDLKYRGERTRLTIGRRNIFREFVTINRGTAGGGGETRSATTICSWRMCTSPTTATSATTRSSVRTPRLAATSRGRLRQRQRRLRGPSVLPRRPARVHRRYSVVTKDALPFARTIGSRPARIFGVNTIGLQRRGFTPNTIIQLRHVYRYLLQSKLNTTRALAQIEQDSTLTAPEVRYMVEFIRSSRRGVILRRAGRRAEELVADE